MRNLLWLCLALFSFSRLTAALPADERLKELASTLPPGWAISMDQHKLELFRKEEVYVLSANRINAPVSMETSQQVGQRVRKFGKRGRCRVEYRLEEKWSDQRRAQAERKNAEIYETEKGLPAKYHIEQLRDKGLSRKGGQVYVGHTPEELRAIESFEQERKQLRQDLVSLPDHNSSHYSLFQVSIEGRDDDMHMVDPIQASQELYQVLNRMNEICKVP